MCRMESGSIKFLHTFNRIGLTFMEKSEFDQIKIIKKLTKN